MPSAMASGVMRELLRGDWSTFHRRKSSVDYDPHAWKYVAKGSCEGMATPKGHGSLTSM